MKFDLLVLFISGGACKEFHNIDIKTANVFKKSEAQGKLIIVRCKEAVTA